MEMYPEKWYMVFLTQFPDSSYHKVLIMTGPDINPCYCKLIVINLSWRDDELQGVAQTYRIEESLNIMKAIGTPACHPQTYIYLSLWECDHLPLFGVKIPLGNEFVVTNLPFSFSTSFKQILFVRKTIRRKFQKLYFIPLKLPEII